MNSIILSFRDNTNHALAVEDGTFVTSFWLNQITGGQAEYIGKNEHGELEIKMPIPVFEKIKSLPDFYGKCEHLVGLRTTYIQPLFMLVYGIRPFNNRLTNE